MEPEQPTSWPPAPKQMTVSTEPLARHLLTGSEKWDGFVGFGIAFLLFILTLYASAQWANLILQFVEHNLWKGLPPEFIINSLFFLPLLVGLILAAAVYFVTRRKLPALNRMFGLTTMVLIGLTLVGWVFTWL